MDKALEWVRECEAYLVEHPGDEQMLDELDLAKANLTWAIQHPEPDED